jgi:large subunit ribosomal protein L29
VKAELIRDLAKEEVEQRLADSQEELFNLRIKMQVQNLDNPLRLRVLRRDIARLKTILHEHEKGIRSLSATTGKILGTGEKNSTEE